MMRTPDLEIQIEMEIETDGGRMIETAMNHLTILSNCFSPLDDSIWF